MEFLEFLFVVSTLPIRNGNFLKRPICSCLAANRLSEYLTYKEWKPTRRIPLSGNMHVSTLPIRNGNQTSHQPVRIRSTSYCSVSTLPIRNGNIVFVNIIVDSLNVSTLPIRNGNYCRQISPAEEYLVSTLPIRNGNEVIILDDSFFEPRVVSTLPIRNGNFPPR